jgi:rhamnopyranosyl-N-acetylglucosaminyl-diphospho-decaprenol beta-1,3/1,4-galactofuranosyltransferase
VPTVVAVVVTYNRRDLVLESLAALHQQTQPVGAVVVVDNASTDGTAAAVRGQFPDMDLVELGHNTGGAGGFATGLSRALSRGADLVWLMDDDTVPTSDALESLLDARANYPGAAPALVASRVIWTDGREHPMNSPRPKPLSRRDERAAAEQVRCVPIRSASFVSVLLDARLCRERGLPVADYFLWNDDFEFTTRILRGKVGLLCPASVVVHKTRTFGSTDADPGERFFYEVRNKIWLLTRSRSLSPLEKVLYGGSTLRRWVRTFAAARDRSVLRRALRRGLWAGLTRGPRPTATVLAGALEPRG